MAFLSLFSKAPNYDSWSCLRPPLFVFSLTQGRKKVKFYPILWHRGHYWQPIVTNGCLFSSPLPPSWRRYRDAKEIPPSVLDSEHKTLDLWGRRCFLSSFFALQMKTKKRGGWTILYMNPSNCKRIWGPVELYPYLLLVWTWKKPANGHWPFTFTLAFTFSSIFMVTT